MPRALLLITLTALAAPGVASAQSNDVFFRSWRWTNDSVDARAAALAGATVARADESASIEDNPAALATLTRSELALSAVSERPGQTAVGDTLESHSATSALSAALRLSRRFCVAFFRQEPQTAHISLAPLTTSDGTRDNGSISAVTTDVGIALAHAFSPRLALGVSAVHSRLGFTAEYERATPTLPATLTVGTGGASDRYTFSAGALLSLGSGVQIGLSHRTGTRWELGRVALSPILSLTLDAGSTTRIARPATTTLGARVALTRRVSVAAQIDRLAAPSVSPGVAQGYVELPVPSESWEPRAAVELALPARRSSVLLRGGVHFQPRPTRVEQIGPPPAATPGSEAWSPPPPAQLFERTPEQPVAERLASRWRFGIGAALVLEAGLRIDLALRLTGDQRALLAGTSWRF